MELLTFAQQSMVILTSTLFGMVLEANTHFMYRFRWWVVNKL